MDLTWIWHGSDMALTCLYYDDHVIITHQAAIPSDMALTCLCNKLPMHPAAKPACNAHGEHIFMCNMCVELLVLCLHTSVRCNADSPPDICLIIYSDKTSTWIIWSDSMGLTTTWIRYGSCMVLTWLWYGSHVDLAWFWRGSDVVLTWFWCGSDMDHIWAQW